MARPIHSSSFVLAIVILLCGLGSTVSARSNNHKSLAALQHTYVTNLQHVLANRQGNCQYENMTVRKSWTALNETERLSYLAAVKCMSELPNKISRFIVPGARNRYDDYTYSHLNQTNFIHSSGLLLPWHRQFIWSHERTIQNECNYTGALPYWDWENYTHNQSQSPLFDGTKTSFGGNGKFIPGRTGNITAPLPGLPSPIVLIRPYGSGGGCVENLGGLPANFTINIGPVSPANNSANNTWGLEYNPRCLQRDFLRSASRTGLSKTNLTTVLNMQTIADFRPWLEANIHPNAHSYIGGNAYDLYTSPSEPVFYLLHAQIDRLWTIWQGQDFANRTNGLDGTVTFANDPPSANATLDTVMKMFQAGGDIPIGRVMSTFDRGFCYRYE